MTAGGHPLNLFVTAGQVSDCIGAWALLSSLPDVDWLLGGRGHDADWFREALEDEGIRACRRSGFLVPNGRRLLVPSSVKPEVLSRLLPVLEGR